MLKQETERMHAMSRLIKFTLSIISIGWLLLCPAQGSEIEDFYRGSRMTMLIGSSTGDGTDLYGRLIAKYISRKIPGNPSFVTINLPGANGLIAANQLYNLVAKDGSTIGTFSRYAAFEALWKNPSARFQPEKFNWIGNVNIDVSVCITWHAANVKGLDEFMMRDLKIGVTNESHVNILDNLFGAQLKAIKGYPGGNEVNMALERGEVDGRCNISWSALVSTNKSWLTNKKVDILLQFSHRKLADLPNVALVTDLVKTEKQRQIINLILTSQMMARVIVSPPEVPLARVAVLRHAFEETMKDHDFLQDARRLGAPVDPVSGDEIQKVISDMFRTPPELVREFQDMVGGKI
jgi:tripartite-type tricarboxylate transporter receptor subunit TctC